MNTKQKFSALNKLLILTVLSISTALLMSFSFAKNPRTNCINSQKLPKIGEIIWEGNKIYSSDTLTKILGLKKGDNYSYNDVISRLTEGDVSTFYFDKGHVFYNAELYDKKQSDGSINLTIKIYEGRLGKIESVSVTGNVKVPDEEILNKITIKPGDLFTKTEIVKSVKAIAAMGKFEPAKIIPTPVPNWDKSTIEFAAVDLVFEVSEKNK